MGHEITVPDYKIAQKNRFSLSADIDAALSGVSVLLLPTLPIPAPVLGTEEILVNNSRHRIRELTLRLTQLFDLTGHPAISLPCGKTKEGLPCGTQLVGHWGKTRELLATASQLEPIIRMDERA